MEERKEKKKKNTAEKIPPICTQLLEKYLHGLGALRGCAPGPIV